jgi:hypothetical protein
VPVVLLPAQIPFGEIVSDATLNGGGVTVTVAVRLAPPSPAVTVAAAFAVTADVATLKVAVVCPAATVTLTGTMALTLLLPRLTSTSLEDAPLRVTVPIEETPPTTLVGATETDVNVIGAVTFRVIVAECTIMPLVPVTVKVYEPTGVELVDTIVNVDCPAPVTDPGVNVAVVPAGSPAMVRLLAAAKLFRAPILIVYVAPAPGVMDLDAGDAAIVKSGDWTPDTPASNAPRSGAVPLIGRVRPGPAPLYWKPTVLAPTMP